MNCNTSQKYWSALRKWHMLPHWLKCSHENLCTQPLCATAVGTVRLRSGGRRTPKHRLDLTRENRFPVLRHWVEPGAQVGRWVRSMLFETFQERRVVWNTVIIWVHWKWQTVGTAVCQELHWRKGPRNDLDWIGLGWLIPHLTYVPVSLNRAVSEQWQWRQQVRVY